MHILSKEEINLVSGSHFGFIYVTPEWKEAEAVYLGKVYAAAGVSLGALAFVVAPTAPTLLAPLVLGGVGYAIGYAVSTLTNAPLEDYSFHFFY